MLAGLASQQWGRKTCAAKSVLLLIEIGGARTLSAHVDKLADGLLQVSTVRADTRFYRTWSVERGQEQRN